MGLSPLSYSLVIMEGERIYGVRDPYGNRPLCIGKILPVKHKDGEPRRFLTQKLERPRRNDYLVCAAIEDEMEPEGWVISSESCGFLSIGARYVREVLPGEIVELTRKGVKTISVVPRPDEKAQAFCIFEYVYFARSDSLFEGSLQL